MIREVFRDEKWKMESLYKYKKQKHKTSTRFTLQLLYSLLKLSQYTIQKVNCVLGYPKINIFPKLVEIIAFPFFGALK